MKRKRGRAGIPPLRGSRVEAYGVGVEKVEEEGGAGGLEDEPEVENPVGNALLENGERPGLADDHVCPLDLKKMGLYYTLIMGNQDLVTWTMARK